jgi:Peroxisome biogenesis factor 1, N-terminal
MLHILSSRSNQIISNRTHSTSLFPMSITKGEIDSYIDLPCSLYSSNSGGGSSERTVAVKALTLVECATELFVEPVTIEDWELLELDAAWLEEGGLLQQVSLVYAGQVLELRLSNGTSARLGVMPRNFERHHRVIWPDDDDAPLPCLRLLADTRVIVAPKPRKKVCSLRLVPTREDYLDDPCVLELASRLNVGLVSVPQGTLVVHPDTLTKIRGFEAFESGTPVVALIQFAARETQSTVASDEQQPDSVFAGVTTSVEIPEDRIGKIRRCLLCFQQCFSMRKNTMLILNYG